MGLQHFAIVFALLGATYVVGQTQQCPTPTNQNESVCAIVLDIGRFKLQTFLSRCFMKLSDGSDFLYNGTCKNTTTSEMICSAEVDDSESVLTFPNNETLGLYNARNPDFSYTFAYNGKCLANADRCSVDFSTIGELGRLMKIYPDIMTFACKLKDHNVSCLANLIECEDKTQLTENTVDNLCLTSYITCKSPEERPRIAIKTDGGVCVPYNTTLPAMESTISQQPALNATILKLQDLDRTTLKLPTVKNITSQIQAINNSTLQLTDMNNIIKNLTNLNATITQLQKMKLASLDIAINGLKTLSNNILLLKNAAINTTQLQTLNSTKVMLLTLNSTIPQLLTVKSTIPPLKVLNGTIFQLSVI